MKRRDWSAQVTLTQGTPHVMAPSGFFLSEPLFPFIMLCSIIRAIKHITVYSFLITFFELKAFFI